MANRVKEKRVNDILLGPLERPLLLFLCAHMPTWVTPDMLTGFGFFASLLAFASYWLTNNDPRFLWLASFAILMNWFGDSLDGNLARYRKIERPRYGFFIDHTVDALNEVLIFLGIGLSPFVDFRLASLALVAYLLLSILVFIRTYVDGTFRIAWIRLGPTEMRLIAILANTTVYFIGNPMLHLPFGSWSLYNIIVALVTLLLFTGYITITLNQAGRLAKIDQVKSTPETSTRKDKKKKAKARVYGIDVGSAYQKPRGSPK